MSRRAAKVVILAAGQGTRMRRPDTSVQMSSTQATMARKGVKALIPIDRPFLDYVLSRAADAGCREACLVIGPGHQELRAYYGQVERDRITVDFAVQPEPLGTADALLAAAPFVGDDPFLVLNSDNCYPASALRALCECDTPAIIGYDRDALVADNNIAAERIARFAIVEADEDGFLRRILEKPEPSVIERMASPILVSMNCWRFSREIFDACRAIDRSPRGEYEIPDAVTHSMRVLHQRYRVIACAEKVLDLSSQRDIANVVRQLSGEDVRL